ncbi:MAG: pilus assembly protein PilP [Deltaproteobacteria bacterium]|nr:pilus assembly protein PilP [Deltaproteobacteria bacterium]
MQKARSKKQEARSNKQEAINKKLYAKSKILSYLLPRASCILILLAGCQQEGQPTQPQPNVAQQVKKEAAKPADTMPLVVENKEDKKEEAAGEVKQRNPFKPFITKTTEKVSVVVPKTPLQKHELDQFKLIAIMWDMNGSIAMIEAPDGKGYSIKKGYLVGNRDGRVKRIDKDKIVVEEKFIEASGETTINEFEIKLPLPKGEEELR